MPSRPGGLHPEALTGRVENWRSAPQDRPIRFSVSSGVGIELRCANGEVEGSHSRPFGCEMAAHFHQRHVFRGPPIMPDGGIAESARGIAPRAAHRTVRKPRDLHGSCNRGKAAAFRLAYGFFLFPVDPNQTSIAGPLRSTIITIASTLLRSRPSLIRASVFLLYGSSACAFSLSISDQVLKFHTNACMRVAPPIHRTPHGQ